MTVFLDLACLIPLMLKTNFSLHLKYSVSFIFSQYVSFIFVIMPIYALFICAFTCFYMYILIDFDCFIQTKHFFNHLKFCKKIKTIITNRLYLNINLFNRSKIFNTDIHNHSGMSKRTARYKINTNFCN